MDGDTGKRTPLTDGAAGEAGTQFPAILDITIAAGSLYVLAGAELTAKIVKVSLPGGKRTAVAKPSGVDFGVANNSPRQITAKGNLLYIAMNRGRDGSGNPNPNDIIKVPV